MYLLSSGGKPGYFPTNTKWGATSTLAGILPGGGLRYFRPNWAMSRGMIPGGGMGAISVDPGTLALGIGALALGMFLFGIKKGPKMRAKKAQRLRHRRDRLSRRISELEA